MAAQTLEHLICITKRDWLHRESVKWGGNFLLSSGMQLVTLGFLFVSRAGLQMTKLGGASTPCPPPF